MVIYICIYIYILYICIYIYVSNIFQRFPKRRDAKWTPWRSIQRGQCTKPEARNVVTLGRVKRRRAHGCFPYSMDTYGYVFHLCPYIYIYTYIYIHIYIYIYLSKKYICFFLQFFCSTWLICSSHGCFRSHGGSPKNHPASLGIPLYSQDSKTSWLWGVDLSRWRWGFPLGSQKDVEKPMVSLWKDTKNRRFSWNFHIYNSFMLVYWRFILWLFTCIYIYIYNVYIYIFVT